MIKNIRLIPLAGICLFILLYIYAALVYPGGNYLEPNSHGFSILHNYWCDLLNEKAQNGQDNPSSPIAITAMIILCVSLTVFWYYLPQAFDVNKLNKATIRIAGIISMIIAMFIFTTFHDSALSYSGFFGGIAFVATLVGLYKSKRFKECAFGLLCLLLGIITFTIYKTREGLIILPLIQKVTLLLCLAWIVLLDFQIRCSKGKYLHEDTILARN